MKNKELIEKVLTLVQQERRIGVEILELLREIEMRKAYADLGYDGLFSFCVKELRYSEAQAYRRIQAMRALKQVPGLKEQIESGRMTVTTVSQVQTYLNEERRKGEPLSGEQAAATFERFADHSAKEVEAGLLTLKGEAIHPTMVVELTPELSAQWTRVRELSAHKTRGQTPEIFQMLMRDWLQRHDPEAAAAKQNQSERPKEPGSSARTSPAGTMSRRASSFSRKVSLAGERATSPSAETRAVPAALRRQVWARDEGGCQKCDSRFALQVDHLRPLAKGGEHSLENLRLLCRSCNLAEGIRVFGVEKMRRTRAAG